MWEIGPVLEIIKRINHIRNSTNWFVESHLLYNSGFSHVIKITIYSIPQGLLTFLLIYLRFMPNIINMISHTIIDTS